MGFRVVDESSFTFKTDLPPSSRHIHPSGVLHAFRSTAPNAMSTNAHGREEHTFAWIDNSLHADEAIAHLEGYGFDRSNDIVFIPYSTKKNWLDRYPHAAPALETTESGKVVVYLNWRPYQNGLSELGQSTDCATGSLTGAISTAVAGRTNSSYGEDVVEDQEEEGNITKTTKEKKKRKWYRGKPPVQGRPVNILNDETSLPDPERDELHVEIYNYFIWLNSRLEQKLEEKRNKADDVAAVNAMASDAENNEEDMENDDDNDDEEEGNNEAITGKRKQYKKKYMIPGVNMGELQGLVNKMESSFMVIGNLKLEKVSEEGPVRTGGQKGVPLLEEAMSKAVKQLVVAREVAGKPKRRSRKRQRLLLDPSKARSMGQWDELFQRLVRYKEEHGDCIVSRTKTDDTQLTNWIHRLRERKVYLANKGLEFEPVPKVNMSARTLTEERLAQLHSIGFVWHVLKPTTDWEVRFQELIEHYNHTGKWPSQSMGSLGLWVHKQRRNYKKGTKKFMETRAPKLDEIGFEWTPRGNTRMSWDVGFELLMEFGRQNGHFNVSCPTGSNVDKKGEAYLFHNWVESLHIMYRSFKLGRQSGSLTDERVVLLMSQGFEFRDS